MANSLSLCFVILSTLLAAVTCNLEGDALSAWKQNLNDPNNVLQSWDPTLVNPCTWLHITCNNDNSVTRIDLGNAGLSGSLVPQLGYLTNLQYLEVYENNLIGAIPVELGNLTRLISLDLRNNDFNGPIPSSLGLLSSLKYMRLNENSLSGEIPQLIGNLTSLVQLDLHFNILAGPIPTSLGNLKSLAFMKLNGNNLTGVIPTDVLGLVRFGNLRILDVSENSLAGSAKRTKSAGAKKFAVTTIIQDPVV